MATLEEYKNQIVTLATSKGWKNDLAWLGLGCFKETGELWAAIEKLNMAETTYSEIADGVEAADYKRKIIDPLEEEIGSEFAGIMHYLIQLMFKVTPNINLDDALTEEIEENSHRAKKTYENERIVRK